MAEVTQKTAGSKTRVRSDETFSIETHGVNTIPLEDRHGHPTELLWVWAGANIIFTYIIIGSLVVLFGLSFWAAVAAIVVGNLFYVLVGIGAISGPKAGTATLVVSRSAFGIFGNIPAAFLSWITVVGWEAVNIVIGTFALYELALLANLPEGTALRAVSLAVIMLVTFTVAIWGHATIVLVQKVFTVLLAVGTVGLAIFVFPDMNVGQAAGPLAADTPFSTWLLALLIITAAPFSWMNYPADYTRYFRRDESSRAIAAWTALGAMIPAIVICIIGAAAATATDMSDPVGGLSSLLPSWFLGPYLAVIVGGSITNNFLNTYSSGLSLLALGVRLKRYQCVLVDAVIGGLVSVYAVFIFDFTNSFIQFLSLMVIWIAPWSGIYLADMLLRRNTYDPEALHRVGGGPYWYSGGWNRRAIASFAIGILGAGAFANAPLWRGPLVGLIGNGDISVFVGFALGFVCYYVSMRGFLKAKIEVVTATPSATGVD